jgi:S1-C subfamily serine protease
MQPGLLNLVYIIGRKQPSGIALLGTAFAVGKQRIATTAHVAGATDKDLVMIVPRGDIGSYQDTTDNSVQTVDVSIAEYDPIKDIAILSFDGKIKFSQLSHTLGSIDETPVGTEIFTLGYPHADHGRMVLTYQRSDVGARILLGSQGIKTKHMVLNSQARPGQSGSPIFNLAGNKVIAMLIGSYAPGGGGGISLVGVDPATLHQTTHAISAEYIGELLR